MSAEQDGEVVPAKLTSPRAGELCPGTFVPPSAQPYGSGRPRRSRAPGLTSQRVDALEGSRLGASDLLRGRQRRGVTAERRACDAGAAERDEAERGREQARDHDGKQGLADRSRRLAPSSG